MATKRYIAKRKTILVLGHICSKCGNPIIHIGTLELCANVTEKFFADNEARAEEALENKYQMFLDDIRSCEKTGYTLGDENSLRQLADDYLYVDGVSDPCPYCSKLEKWQGKGITETISSESYPTIFDSFDEAKEWAESLIREKAVDIASDRKNVDIQALQEETEYLREFLLIERLKQESSALTKKENSIKEAINELEDAVKKAGAFDLKKKLDLNKQKKEKEKELAAIAPQIQIAKEEYEARTSESIARADKIEPLAYGPTGRARIVTNSKSANCYLVETNLPASVVTKREELLEYYTSNPAAYYMFGVQRADISSNIKRCKKCGAEVPAEASFCQNCGEKV